MRGATRMTRIIKVGGRPQADAALPRALAAAHRQSSGGMIVVHGGGDEVSMLQALHGASAEFRDGRRVTSELDLSIIRMALSGSANKRLVSALVSEGVPAIGLSGEDGALLAATPLDRATLGFVGVPEVVNVGLLQHLVAGGYLPVISPVSRSTRPDDGATLNVNGDDAAAAIAVAIEADELLLVSDVEGVLVSGAAVGAIGPEDAQRMIDDGTAKGGMSAKLRAALVALEGGVERVRISDIAAIEDLERGTTLTRVGSMCT